MENPQAGLDFDLRPHVRVLWKRKWYAIGAFVLCVLLAGVYTFTRTPMYEATATLFVGQQQVNLQDVGQGLALTNLSARLIKSYAEVIGSRTVAERTVRENALPLSPGAVTRELSVTAPIDTQILKVTFRSRDPALAERVVNAVAATFVSQVGETVVPAPASTPIPGRTEASPPQPASPALTVSIIDPARRPDSPVFPNHKRDVALGVVFGALAGAALAFGRDHFDSSVKGREDTQRLGLPVVGMIPKIDTTDDEIYVARDPQDVASEAFRKIRMSVGFLGVDKPIKTLLITSPIAGEGKTTVALNLAAVYAQAGNRTLLIEADLRRPTLHHVFGMTGTDGLTTAIVGHTPSSRALRNGAIPNLQCIVAGAIPPNPVELLESEQMDQLLQHLRTQFDMVIVDAPPIMPVADAIALGPRCDGVVIVGRSGTTHKERLLESVSQIEKSGARFLGVVLNCVKPSDSPYEYEYYYAYRAGSPSRSDSIRATGREG